MTESIDLVIETIPNELELIGNHRLILKAELEDYEQVESTSLAFEIELVVCMVENLRPLPYTSLL